MNNYRIRPFEVEAIQVRENNDFELLDFFQRHNIPFDLLKPRAFLINTNDAEVKRAEVYDWITRDEQGRIEIYRHIQFRRLFNKI